MTDKPDYLDTRREELLEQYEQTYMPKVLAAQRRLRAMGRITREVAVQALATIIGGAVLAGAAVAIGWLGSDPTLRAYGGSGAIALVLLLIMSIWTAARPLDTSTDATLARQLRELDALIAERDKRRAEEAE
ncbi:hypothetical protein [Enteractinococcus helveticum]|uniref:Uncharacterized protein n=1 Tax=Enteractinococcus helveticum TaxID=1837282 RepID=A0A1B7M305_9MICC|nr:hypothetical protein [Enteractinococcus helveticum]OAV62958.1 hypothetical protein A6F49_03935 [Enteractinococcus helveticum]